jgi:hypothetical protein
LAEPQKSKTASELEGRFIGDLYGSCVFPDRLKDEAMVHAFHARSISPRQAVVSAEVEVSRGEPVALRFDTLGIRHGEIDRVFKGGFVVRFPETEGVDDALTRSIDWLKQKSRGKIAERRRHRRVLPRDGAAKLILGADLVVPCTIEDMSRSGAAILCDEAPALGRLVAVGSVPGRVVRHFSGGFGMEFVELQSLDMLEALMTLRNAAEKSLAVQRLNQTSKRLG